MMGINIEKIAKKFWLFFADGETTRPVDLEDLQAFSNEIIEMCALELDLKVVGENADEWTITREMAFKRASEALRNLKG